MNFLKKKIKPLTSGFINNSAHSSNKQQGKADQDLEDDLYDEYVVEAPPHPSELLALGIDPNEIDVNDPEKLKELYRKAKEEGKDKKTNSTLLARERQKEEIEQKKKTREEWKFFDSITARVEQVVKESQRTLDHLKESSAIDKLTEPDYELRLSADQVFTSSATVKAEKSANNWIDFSEESNSKKETDESSKTVADNLNIDGVSSRKTSLIDPAILESQNYIAEELLNDFGIDLRTAEQKKASQQQAIKEKTEPEITKTEVLQKTEIDLKAAARPRPRPRPNQATTVEVKEKKGEEADPFDTSFISAPVDTSSLDTVEKESNKTESENQVPISTRVLDPFDTSYVNL